ncbi:MAG: hypothetical protein Q8L48_32865 [Archangium sp.]|nr:hypothetical protein [Archangium sp.]
MAQPARPLLTFDEYLRIESDSLVKHEYLTSTSTEKYDRAEKLDQHKKISSLREVVLVSHGERLIEVWRKAGTRWSHHEFRDVAQLTSIGCSLSLADVYLDPLAA